MIMVSLHGKHIKGSPFRPRIEEGHPDGIQPILPQARKMLSPSNSILRRPTFRFQERHLGSGGVNGKYDRRENLEDYDDNDDDGTEGETGYDGGETVTPMQKQKSTSSTPQYGLLSALTASSEEILAQQQQLLQSRKEQSPLQSQQPQSLSSSRFKSLKPFSRDPIEESTGRAGSLSLQDLGNDVGENDTTSDIDATVAASASGRPLSKLEQARLRAVRAKHIAEAAVVGGRLNSPTPSGSGTVVILNIVHTIHINITISFCGI